MPSAHEDARSDAVRYHSPGTLYLCGLEVGAGLLVDREGLLLELRELDRLTLERLEEPLERLTLERLEDRLLERLTLGRDLEVVEGRLDRTEEEPDLLGDRTPLLLRETLEPREELLPVTTERGALDWDREPTLEFLDPLLPRDLEKRLPTLLRGIVVTWTFRLRLRLEEVRALPVDATLRAPRGALATLGSPDRALELAVERPARVEVRDLEKLLVTPRWTLVVSAPRFLLVSTALRGRLWLVPAASLLGSPVFRLSTRFRSMLLTRAPSTREARKSSSVTTVSPEPGSW